MHICDAYDFEKWTQMSLFNSNIVKYVNKEIQDIFHMHTADLFLTFHAIQWNILLG